MKTKLIIVMGLLTAFNVSAMDKNDPALKENAQQPWDWFITHLNLTNKTKSVTCSISKFDPVVRIYDAETSSLLVALQRLTLTGKNTDLEDNGVSTKAFRITDTTKPDYAKLLLEIYNFDSKIMSLEIDGIKNSISSFKTDGTRDFFVDLDKPNGSASMQNAIIRLSPSYVYVCGESGPAEFFKELHDKHIASQQK